MKTEWGLVGTPEEQAEPIPIALHGQPSHRRKPAVHMSMPTTPRPPTTTAINQIDGSAADRVRGLPEVEA